MKGRIFAIVFLGVGLAGCSTTSIITSRDNLNITAEERSGCGEPVPEGVMGVVGGYAVHAVAGHILDDVEEWFDKKAKSYIQQYKIRLRTSDLYNSIEGGDKFSNSGVCKSVVLGFNKKEAKNKGLEFIFYLKANKKSSEMKVEMADGSKEIHDAGIFQKSPYPGTATLNLKWSTFWREANRTYEKVVFDGKLMAFEFNKQGKVELENSSSSVSLPLPPYSVIDGNPEQSTHALDFTLTVVNTDDSEIIKRLAKSFDEKKGEIREAIVEAYKNSVKKEE